MNWEFVLPADLVARLKQRLGGDFASFAIFCEANGVLENNFRGLVRTMQQNFGALDLDFLCAMFGSTIVSAANGFGANAQLGDAKKLANWALALEPNHLPALMCLANVFTLEGDTKRLAETQMRIQSLSQRLLSAPEAQLSSFEKGIAETLRRTGS